MKRLLFPLCMSLILVTQGYAQKKEKKTATDNKVAEVPVKKDSVKLSSIKPYAEVITAKAKSTKGLFTIHKIEDKYYFEIPDSLLGRDMLLVNRISKAANSMKIGGAGFAGDPIDDKVIRFEKGPGYKVFIKKISYNTIVKDSIADGMYKAVVNSNIQPIIASMPIKAIGLDKTSSVIDVTDYLTGDNSLFWLGPKDKKAWGIGVLQSDRSYVNHVRTFQTNLEINAVKTYSSISDPSGVAVTCELNSSLVLLPKKPMIPRYADARVGYFSQSYVDFDTDPQAVKLSSMITRWRLEPKDEDRDKYFRGELVEPKKPILYYIDPATPKKWVPYLIKGVNDWQVAFEKAGFKNAIMAKEAPAADSTWSLEDATHSAIVYKPSDVANASGPHIHDPRSGEIIESHINWYHNVMTILHDWYMIQAGAIDPRARKMELDDELMGQLIRFVSSHEVGHTLGLMHNFGSSSTVPVDSLRNKKWVEMHGHTPSIMDYARFNYVAQPEDHIGSKGIYPRIGDYDKWAIEWGYRLFPGINEAKIEKAFLNKWIIDSISNNHRLWYGPQLPFGTLDPRSQNEDLGDDAVKASNYGIKNLKRILIQLPEWTRVPNEGYEDLSRMYEAVVEQFGRYAGHVMVNVGGYYMESKSVEEKGKLFLPVPVSKQKQAVSWLNEKIFKTPTWLQYKPITEKTESPYKQTIVEKLGKQTLKKLLDESRMTTLIRASNQFGDKQSYTCTAFLEDLKKGIWSELLSHTPINPYRRELQSDYVNNLTKIINPAPVDPAWEAYIVPPPTDLIIIVRQHLRALKKAINMNIAGTYDAKSKAHLQYMAEKIDRAFDPKTFGKK
ncbi:zinc-dependent metalloprotease [Pedobacter sp. BG31]|uniref:zinc-dependent metalloprotease n=1 Tax=Pedobacter sp. BG31 TaxID=3349697 RepID=UPI0035F448F2